MISADSVGTLVKLSLGWSQQIQ